MALIKDGKVYRTVEEQVVHLTNAHERQLEINDVINKELQEISVAANLGGYNLVRFSFEKSGTFYRFREASIGTTLSGDENDYVEISSNNSKDIPAYGYYDLGGRIELSYYGDFSENYSTLTLRNVTKGTSTEISVSLIQFDGSSLLDYNPNERKKQLFNVLEDLNYGGRTQYVSFDLNNDGIYNFVFIGANPNGKDGRSIFATKGTDFETIKNAMNLYDLLLIGVDNPNIPDIPNALRGQIYIYNGLNSFELKSNILGPKGDKGDKGETGEQGIQGVQGFQGPQGEKGDKGDKGDPGDQGIIIFTGVLNSPSELPEFSTTKVGDAYRVINTSGAIVSYDLYFHAQNGIDWDIQPNWGGVKGDKGDTGNVGPQGIQGPQGTQGPQGEKGNDGGNQFTHYITFNYISNDSNYFVEAIFTIVSDISSIFTGLSQIGDIIKNKLFGNNQITMQCSGYIIDIKNQKAYDITKINFSKNRNIATVYAFKEVDEVDVKIVFSEETDFIDCIII